MSNIVKKKYILIALFFVFFAVFLLSYFINSNEPVKKNEAYYQIQFCDKEKGIAEFVLPDRTRVDCLTDVYAIEVDWAKKWAEGVVNHCFMLA
jgi:hypothetical protein